MAAATAQMTPEIHHNPDATPTTIAGMVNRMGITSSVVSRRSERYPGREHLSTRTSAAQEVVHNGSRVRGRHHAPWFRHDIAG